MPRRQSISAVFLRLCHLLFPFSTPDLLFFFLFLKWGRVRAGGLKPCIKWPRRKPPAFLIFPSLQLLTSAKAAHRLGCHQLPGSPPGSSLPALLRLPVQSALLHMRHCCNYLKSQVQELLLCSFSWCQLLEGKVWVGRGFLQSAQLFLSGEFLSRCFVWSIQIEMIWKSPGEYMGFFRWNHISQRGSWIMVSHRFIF